MGRPRSPKVPNETNRMVIILNSWEEYKISKQKWKEDEMVGKNTNILKAWLQVKVKSFECMHSFYLGTLNECFMEDIEGHIP